MKVYVLQSFWIISNFQFGWNLWIFSNRVFFNVPKLMQTVGVNSIDIIFVDSWSHKNTLRSQYSSYSFIFMNYFFSFLWKGCIWKIDELVHEKIVSYCFTVSHFILTFSLLISMQNVAKKINIDWIFNVGDMMRVGTLHRVERLPNHIFTNTSYFSSE